MFQILKSALDFMSEEKRKKTLESTKFSGIPCPLFSAIGPLRLLLAKESKPRIWSEFMSGLMTHDDERKKDEKTWMLNHLFVVGFLKSACRLDR